MPRAHFTAICILLGAAVIVMPTTLESATSRSRPRTEATGRSSRPGVSSRRRSRIATGSGIRSTPSSRPRLEANGLSPAPEADRTDAAPPAQLRPDRAAADARGDRCLRERPHRPMLIEKVVDRLLASPHYGVRWAQHWLDLARYADTDGFEFDQARPNAWRYRDWVVDALNRDMPYDQFVRLQLAGDEIAPDDPSAFVATGFNRCYPDMVDLNDQGLRRQNALNDITETTGPGLPRPDDRLRPLPRPQVRPDPPGRLLPAPGVLQPGAVPRRLSARKGPDAAGVRAGRRRLAGRGRRRSRRRSCESRSRSATGLHQGLPMGALDEAVAAYNKPECRAEPGRGHDGLRPAQPRRPDQGQRLARLARRGRCGRTCAALRQARASASDGRALALPTARGIDEAGQPRTADLFPEARRVHREGTGRRTGVSRPCWQR